MTLDLDSIFEAARLLPREQQQELLRRLTTLQAPDESSVDPAAWRQINERRAEYDAGKVATLSWDEVKARLDARK